MRSSSSVAGKIEQPRSNAAVDRCFDGRIQELDDYDEQQAGDEHKALVASASQPQRDWRQDNRHRQFLAKCGFVTPRMCESLRREYRRTENSFQTGVAGFAHD